MIPLEVQFHLGGAFATQWLADTIAGHLCWAVVRLHGADILEMLIEEAIDGKPAFVVSDGFPEGMLPAPVLPITRPERSLPEAKRRELFSQGKRWREIQRRNLVPMQVFQALQRGQPPPLLREQQDWSASKSRSVIKNQLSRATSTTGDEGQLFTFSEIWLKPPHRLITVYALVQEEYRGLFDELVEEMGMNGFGKRKSVGYGNIRQTKVSEHVGFNGVADPNGFLSLSTFVPSPTDPTDGQWDVLVKRGKLGEELAASQNPFKSPLVMLRSGATFRTDSIQELYGTVVQRIAPGAPQVVQWAFAYPVPFRLPE